MIYKTNIPQFRNNLRRALLKDMRGQLERAKTIALQCAVAHNHDSGGVVVPPAVCAVTGAKEKTASVVAPAANG